MFETTPASIDDFMYGATVAKSHVSIRLGFLRKVYGILSVQLGLTTLICGIMLFFQSPLTEILHSNPWILMICFIASIALIVAMFVCRQKTPHNFILLLLFTLVESVTVGFVVIHYTVSSVITVLMLTMVVTISLTLYALQTKRDFSCWGAALFSCLIILMFGGLIQSFMHSPKMDFLISLGGAFLFSMLIIYDTWMSLHRLSPEDYILACIDLYLDIINLFLHLLHLLGQMRDN